jgi:hypothetical protein
MIAISADFVKNIEESHANSDEYHAIAIAASGSGPTFRVCLFPADANTM